MTDLTDDASLGDTKFESRPLFTNSVLSKVLSTAEYQVPTAQT